MDKYCKRSIGCSSLIKNLAASQIKKTSPKKSAQKYVSSNSNGYRGYSNVFSSESYGSIYSRSCLIESNSRNNNINKKNKTKGNKINNRL